MSGPCGPGPATLEVTTEESADGVDWVTCAGTGATIGANEQTQLVAAPETRWFRLRFTLCEPGRPDSWWVTDICEEPSE